MADLHIEIKSIGFNYDLFGNSNAFPLFDNDEKRLIKAPEWDTDPERIRNDPAAYAIGHKITMQVNLGITGFNEDVGPREIIIKASGEKYGVKPKSFHLHDRTLIEDDCIKGQIFEFTHVFDKVGIYTFTLNWEYTDVEKCKTYPIGETEHKFFILLDTPKAPMHFPNWVQVLEKVCCWARDSKSGRIAAKKITEKLKKSGKLCAGGNGRLTEILARGEKADALFLQGFMDLLAKPEKVDVECYDIAYLLDVFLKSIGLDSSIIYIKSPIKTKNIKLIGRSNIDPKPYKSHCLVEYDNLWFDPFIDYIIEENIITKPVAISRNSYLQTLLVDYKSQIKNLIIQQNKNYHIQYRKISALNADSPCKEGKETNAERSFVKHISQGWHYFPRLDSHTSEINIKKIKAEDFDKIINVYQDFPSIKSQISKVDILGNPEEVYLLIMDSGTISMNSEISQINLEEEIRTKMEIWENNLIKENIEFIKPKNEGSFHLGETLTTKINNIPEVAHFLGDSGNILFTTDKGFVIHLTQPFYTHEFQILIREKIREGEVRRKTLIQKIKTTGSFFHKKDS